MTTTQEETYKILVVDDEPDLEPLVLQRMRRSIRAGRYTFVFAHNGIEALEKLNADGEIDMVLSDINMPQMDGLTLLEQIPKVDPNLRAVIISAYGDMKNIRTAMNRGAFDFVTKPVDFEDLQVTIDRTLRNMAEWREALESRDKLVSLQNELDVARSMQQSILPTQFPKSPKFKVHGKMQAARNVGGDFFDVLPLGDDSISLAVADVSGKGVPAALFMMSSRTLLKGSAIGVGTPTEVLREVNDLLVEGDIAAYLGARQPDALGTHPGIVRLFPDYRRTERDYFRETGIFPIMHAIVMREELHAEHPWIAESMFKAFQAAKAWTLKHMSFSGAMAYMVPWLNAEMDEIRELFGGDPYPYGVEANRNTLDTFMQYLVEQAFVAEPRPALEDLFTPIVGWAE